MTLGETAAATRRNQATPAPAVLDGAALGEIRAIDPEGTRGVLARLVRLYLGTAPRLLRTLQDQAALDDPVGLWQAAHALKAASANLGAVRVAALCRALEVLGRAGGTEGAAGLAAAAAYDEARRALSALVGGNGHGPD